MSEYSEIAELPELKFSSYRINIVVVYTSKISEE